MREHSQEFKEQELKAESALEVFELTNLVKASENFVASSFEPFSEEPKNLGTEKKVSFILNFYHLGLKV